MSIEEVIDAAGFVGGLVASTGAATLAKEGAKIIIEKSVTLNQNELGAQICEWSAGVIGGAVASWAISRKTESYKKLVRFAKRKIDEAKKEEEAAAKAEPVKVEVEVVN